MLELALATLVCATPAPQAEVITFQQAVDRALRGAPAMRSASQDVARASAQVEQARAPALPTLSANGAYTRLDDDRILAGNPPRVAAGKDQLSTNLTVTVPLVSAARWGQWWRAGNALDAARAGADEVRRQVAVSAARAWLAVLGQKRVLDATTSARDTAKVHLDYAKERRVGGVGTRLDELRAAQELAVSRTQLETAAGQLVRLQESLGVAVGSDVPLDVPVVEPELVPPASMEEALGSVSDARLDVKAATVRRDVSLAATRVDFTDYLPLLTAVFQPFTQNPPSLVQPLTGWQAQLVLSIPLYDGGLRYGQAHERRALAASAELQLETSLRQAKSDVRTAFASVTHADQALSAAREAAQEATEALELANVAYTTGATTNLEVIDAERRARDARTAAAVAEDAARQARLDLLVASGRFP